MKYNRKLRCVMCKEWYKEKDLDDDFSCYNCHKKNEYLDYLEKYVDIEIEKIKLKVKDHRDRQARLITF
jgi:hypothetical protein